MEEMNEIFFKSVCFTDLQNRDLGEGQGNQAEDEKGEKRKKTRWTEERENESFCKLFSQKTLPSPSRPKSISKKAAELEKPQQVVGSQSGGLWQEHPREPQEGLGQIFLGPPQPSELSLGVPGGAAGRLGWHDPYTGSAFSPRLGTSEKHHCPPSCQSSP